MGYPQGAQPLREQRMAKLTDAQCKEAIDVLNRLGGNQCKAADILNISRSTFQSRIRAARQRGYELIKPDLVGDYHGRIHVEIENGIVLVGSDCHYWNEAPSTTHRALLHFCKELKPKCVVLNGDVLDGATISRHPPINWEARPSLVQEMEACKERLGEIEDAAKGAERIWTLGNHDARFESKLARDAPEYANIHGMHLKDHFEKWKPCWSTWFNNDMVVKHRFKGGMYAPQNNTLWAGKTIVTGHLHSAKVMPITDYSGTRFGVDTGCVADPWAASFEYLEDSPRNWRSAFGVFTFWRGKLLWPELCHSFAPGRVEFRGKVIDV